MTPKDIAIGFLSNLIRALIVAGISFLAATHPAIGHIVSANCPELVVQMASAFLAAVVVALIGAWLRVLRHNKIVEKAYQAGVKSAMGTAARAQQVNATLGKPQAGRVCIGVIIGLITCLLAAGCLAPVSVNVFSSRMVIQSTNVCQSIEGGANLSSNTTTATVPLR